MAQGDSWDDPIIIGENAETPAEVWADFMSKKWSGTAGQCMRFKDIHTTISGTGKATDPYQVSTYHEMLTATGAEYIWQCKLIDYDEESPTAIRTYIYDDGETVKYCAFDPTPTTIDFNDIYEGLIAGIQTNCKIDVNGWTWLNFRIACSRNEGILHSAYDYYNADSYFANLILLNGQMEAAADNDYRQLFSAKVMDSIIQTTVNYSGNGSLIWFYTTTRSNRYFYRCSCKLKINAPNATICGGGYYESFYAEDCVFDFDITAGTFSNMSNGYFDCVRSVIKGKIKADNTSYYFGANHDTIFDISDSEGREIKAPLAHDRSVFNSDKINITYNPSEYIDRHSDWRNQTGLAPVTSEQLLSPTALRAAGLSIGVDT